MDGLLLEACRVPVGVTGRPTSSPLPSRLILGRLSRHPRSALDRELGHLLVVREGDVDGLEGASKSCILLGKVELALRCR